MAGTDKEEESCLCESGAQTRWTEGCGRNDNDLARLCRGVPCGEGPEGGVALLLMHEGLLGRSFLEHEWHVQRVRPGVLRAEYRADVQ